MLEPNVLAREVLCEFYILAVGCDYTRKTTVVRVVCSCVNIVNFRHCCDLPQTFMASVAISVAVIQLPLSIPAASPLVIVADVLIQLFKV